MKCFEFNEKENEDYCKVLTNEQLDQINEILCNMDGSSKLITNLLGFLDTNNALAQVGPYNYAFGLIPNLVYKTNSYLNTIQTYNIAFEQTVNYKTCTWNTTGEDYDNPAIISYKSNSFSLNFKLPICKDPDGKYSFYTNNYMFIKLLNPIFQNQTSGSQIVQVRSTDGFSGNSDDKYVYKNDEVDGVTINTLEPQVEECNDLTPSLYPDKIGGLKVLSKDVDNLFAKIKFSGMSGGCVPDNPITNEVIYFEGNVNNLDEFVVQLVDYEGKIIRSSREHSFTLMIIEKLEVLKETNINSRTNYVNSSGSVNVLRNNYSM